METLFFDWLAGFWFLEKWISDVGVSVLSRGSVLHLTIFSYFMLLRLEMVKKKRTMEEKRMMLCSICSV